MSQSKSSEAVEIVQDGGSAAKALLVAIYLRQSDKEQRLSIAQQRKECRAYATARGWIVVAEYVDDGKSGSKEVHKRREWHRLIADAEKKDKAFAAILCWDTSRFGRLDALAGAPYKNRLRMAGVWLETVRGEKIDWNVSRDRLFDAFAAESDNAYSLNISNNVVRGRRNVVDLGFWATVCPYGYDRRYVEGEIVRAEVRRTDSLGGKPRNWRLVLVPNGDEAATVRWLFQQWATRDISTCAANTDTA